MNLTIYTLKSLAYAIANPSMALILILLCVFLYRKNSRITMMQKIMVGERFISPIELTLSQLVLGILGGAIGSIILTNVGVMFHENSGIDLIFLFSFFLMFIKPRYICFSYSGAILGLLTILLNYLGSLGVIKNTYLSNIQLDIMALITLIAILHIVEGFLIAIDGSKGAIPVFTHRDGKLIGGFSLERYWPLPIAIMFLTTRDFSVSSSVINTPEWWPLIKGDVNMALIGTAIASVIPIYGVLGYKSITFTKSKKTKALISGIFNVIYGIILIGVAYLTKFGLAAKIIALILMPTLHEGMIFLQMFMETKDKAKFVSDDEGVTVLEVAPNSEAWNVGIKSGDKILEIDDNKVIEYTMIYEAISKGIKEFKLKIRDAKGKIKEVIISTPSGNKRLGIVLIPKVVPGDESMIQIKAKSFKDVLDNLKDKDKK